MAHRKHSHRHTLVSALPMRSAWQRAGFFLLVFLAAWLLILGQLRPQLLTPARVEIVDRVAPLLDAMSSPAESVRSIEAAWQEWFNLRAELQQLRTENARLKGWEQTGTSLLAENQSLKQLLKFHAEPAASSLTARVIATTGAPYAASLIVTAGSRDGVQKNMAAMTEDGLVGRVIEVGEWSARILLLTDPESRIPAMVQDNGAQTILTGTGDAQLQPRFLPTETRLTNGTRLVTSGHGGLLPPNLPVGVVQDDGAGHNSVVYPAVDLSRLHYVRLMDYTLAGGTANSLGRSLAPSNP